MAGKGNLQLTGKLGEVIRESAQIGLSWVRCHAYELGITKEIDTQFLNDRDIHVHMPEGSIGKEGPSAGTALVSAFVSLFTKTKINPDIGKSRRSRMNQLDINTAFASYDRRNIIGRTSASSWRFK